MKTPGDTANNAPVRNETSMQRITRVVQWITATDGSLFPADAPKTLTYDGSGNLETVTATWLGKTYVQTLTYTGSQLTADSGFVKQ